MSLDKTTVRRIAHLARIQVTDNEVDDLAHQLSGILEWVRQLEAVPTDHIEPMASPTALHLRWREDEVNDGGRPEAVVANAPERLDGFFAVPKMVE